ncbi:MAG: hypothetical protein KAI81_04330 [Candidatus Marinimicrobia bacterium]|nr:hypothetical protein [Candidatus Neomarinimicrobiota bacterium]
MNLPETQHKKEIKKTDVSKEYGISLTPKASQEPMILYSFNNTQFGIVEQHTKVDLEKSMIKDETNIPASLSNKINKIWLDIKQIFHKKAPTTIKLTKRIEIENRNLVDTYKNISLGAIIIGIVIIHLISKKG